MAVLGIIICEILELETAYLLHNDPEVSRVIVLEDVHSRRLLETLITGDTVPVESIPHLSSYRPEPSEKLDILVRVLPSGLHRQKELLRKRLTTLAREMERYVQGLMLGYGLCGGALSGPAALLDIGIPLFIPQDNERPVDDCVSLCLGGREPYYREQLKVPGTYYLTPGWTQHWHDMFEPGKDNMIPCFARRLFKGYKRLLVVQSPVVSRAEMQRRTMIFLEQTGLNLAVEEQQGTLQLLRDCWNTAKLCTLGNCQGDAITNEVND